jgi:hypothetical protein
MRRLKRGTGRGSPLLGQLRQRGFARVPLRKIVNATSYNLSSLVYKFKLVKQ